MDCTAKSAENVARPKVSEVSDPGQAAASR